MKKNIISLDQFESFFPAKYRIQINMSGQGYKCFLEQNLKPIPPSSGMPCQPI